VYKSLEKSFSRHEGTLESNEVSGRKQNYVHYGVGMGEKRQSVRLRHPEERKAKKNIQIKGPRGIKELIKVAAARD
jgi:hypothetical protein